jgi:DNA topoisomerase-1
MAKNLIIVESPAKTKTIGKFLGKDYKIEASMGHFRDLPKSTLGVDVDNKFAPKYITVKGRADIVKKLKKDAAAAKHVFLATDPDREGEAISWHLANILGIDTGEKCRITFNEITKDAVKNAIKEPRAIDMNLVNAQQGRRILDRIVGYKISPLLWKKVKKGLSAGRVQSVATRFVCEREEKIEGFIPEEYWNLSAKLSKANDRKEFDAKYYGYEGKKVALKSVEGVDKVLSDVEGQKYFVKEVKEIEKKKQAPLPFITSTLQQEASRKLGFSTSKTMIIAQQLYEGVQLFNGEQVGLITYMRTDSTRISVEHQEKAKAFIAEKYGEAYVGGEARVAKKKANTQDAHEAIRPSDVEYEPTKISSFLSRDQVRLYKLIWERYVASQMSSAIYDTVNATIEVNKHIFKANGSKIKFKGFLAVYTEGKDVSSNDQDVEPDKDEDVVMPPLEKDEELDFKKISFEQKYTQPPSRYTEATLVKALEEEGIGRPSTYAPTIGTILARGYVIKEKKFLYPTELGIIVDGIMKNNFAQIVDAKFTATMESKLDEVETGNVEWVQIIEDFYGPFMENLEKAEEAIEKITLKDEETDIICEKCGRNMVIKLGKFGKFLACPGFPECRNAKPILIEAGVSCPLCGENVLIKKTKRGKNYLACSKNPECAFMSWDMPAKKDCPKCGKFVLQKNAGKNIILNCSNPDCDYTETQPRKRDEDE